MENEIIRNLKHDENQGAIFYKGVRYLLIRPETIMGMFKSLAESIGLEKAGEIFYEGGYEGGKASGIKFRQVFNLSAKEAAEYICQMGNKIGWGNFTLDEFDEKNKSLTITVKSSPFAEQMPGSGEAVCHFLRGVIGGLGSASFDSEAQAEEISCTSKGDEVCRFRY